MKCTCPTQKFRVGTRRNLYSTGLRLGFASGKRQLLGFAPSKNAKKMGSPNARDTNMLVYFALGNAKFWRRVQCPTPTPDARYFAFWWNIGFTLRVPLLCRSKSFSLFKSKTFPLPLHGHFSQLVGLPTYLIVSNTYISFPNADDARRCEYMSKHDTCQLDVATQQLQPAYCPTALILNSVSGVKAYCHFKLLIQSVLSPPHIDYLLHGHYLLTNIPSLSVICKNSSISDVRVIQGCSSCLYNFPCHCTIRTSNLTSYTEFHGRAYKLSSKVHLVGFTVNLGFFQHVNMSLAKLIDPSRHFAESFGLTKTEHFVKRSLNSEIVVNRLYFY